MGHISKRTTRAKLMSYLSAQAVKAKSRSFTIPFNRQELADFLFVDRSALSTELGKLRDEGVISFSKSSFELL
jgi:CRP-like cAMP-binding protein